MWAGRGHRRARGSRPASVLTSVPRDCGGSRGGGCPQASPGHQGTSGLTPPRRALCSDHRGQSGPPGAGAAGGPPPTEGPADHFITNKPSALCRGAFHVETLIPSGSQSLRHGVLPPMGSPPRSTCGSHGRPRLQSGAGLLAVPSCADVSEARVLAPCRGRVPTREHLWRPGPSCQSSHSLWAPSTEPTSASLGVLAPVPGSTQMIRQRCSGPKASTLGATWLPSRAQRGCGSRPWVFRPHPPPPSEG